MSRAQRRLLEKCQAYPHLRPSGSNKSTVRVLELMAFVRKHADGTFSVTEAGNRKLASLPARFDINAKVLEYLANGGDGQNATKIANGLTVKLPATLRAISKLEQDGLVERRISADDGRIRRVHLCH